MHVNPLRYCIKGKIHYIRNCRYSDMAGIVFTHFLFAHILLAFALNCLTKQQHVSIKSPNLTLTLKVAFEPLDLLNV